MEPKKLLLLHYTDLAGILRSVEVPFDSLENGSRFPASLDGSSAYGLASVERSDLLLEPDRETLKPVPWLQGVYRTLCRIYAPPGVRFEKDPRLVAERTNEHLESHGLEARVGVELEFNVFKNVIFSNSNPLFEQGYKILPLSPRELPKASYQLSYPNDPLLEYRLELARVLELFDIKVAVSHHEVAVSQIEISMGSAGVVKASDNVVTSKWIARSIAERVGLKAVFMPKPIYGDNGNGMHIHVSLWDRSVSKNLFSDEEKLSDLALHFIGGVLAHARSLAALLAPTTNSYKRLVAGYEAPVYIAWGYYNRTAMVRIPHASNHNKTRIEIRMADPSANPYLAVSAVIMAGLDGIRKKLDPGEPVSENLYKLKKSEAKAKGIEVLPRSLDEALDELESDNNYLKPVFSQSLLEAYIEVKRNEALAVRSRPHPYEYQLYLGV
ncbi:MAG: type I glutamate--ammonia ligase [Acidilobaceae archaeon]